MNLDDATESDATGGAVLFGPFELWPQRRELRRDGALVQLSSRALQLLSLLVERAGEVVGRGELTAHLWPDGGVEESSLRAHVASLRKALGEDRYILNVLGRGYIFVARCRRHAAGAPALPLPHGAVLPPPGALYLLGRDEAIAVVRRQVGRQRLVSVVGAGGLGKSAVARAVAAGLGTGFADGVCLVDLAPIGDDAGVALALVTALGAGVHDTTTALGESLRGRRLLLVLDNCEHLADAVATLAERLLADTDAVHLLVTSREALCLQEEWVYRLAPLDESGAGEAPRLFAARAAQAGLALGADDDARVLRLCRQLDGNPLAIELAAAQAAVSGIDRLEAGLDCLLASPHLETGAGARHRTLGAMLDWSVRLLAPHERAVLRRLAVFRTGFTLDWAAQVCSCARIAPAQVVESILMLSASSLVNTEDAGVSPRYRLANTTRLYAQRELEQAGEGVALRRSHARSVHALCVQADADLLRLPATDWRARYAAIADDVAAALDWALAPGGDAALGIDLVAAACFVLVECGRGDAQRRRVLLALHLVKEMAAPDTALEQRLLVALTLLDAHFIGDDGREDGAWARARLLELAEREGSGEQALIAFQAVAGWGLGQGLYPLVLEMAERIAAYAARAAEPAASVVARWGRAQALHYLGRQEEAMALAQAALDHAPRRRNVHYLTKVPVQVSMGVLKARILWIRGYPDAAQQLADETLAHAVPAHPHALCMALAMAALPVALWRGDSARATLLADRFDTAVEHWGSAFWQPWRDSYRRLMEMDGQAAASGPPPSNSVLRDLLASFDPALADAACVARVRAGTVAWNAPEVLRALGVQRLRAGAPTEEVAALFREARALARKQGARAWELRAAISLALLWTGTEHEAAHRAALAQLAACFQEGTATFDLAQARALLAAGPKPRAPAALWCASLLEAR